MYLGPLTKVRVELADTVEGGVQTIEAIVTNDGTKLEPARGHQVDIALPPDSLHVIPGDVSDEVAVPDPEEAVADIPASGPAFRPAGQDSRLAKSVSAPVVSPRLPRDMATIASVMPTMLTTSMTVASVFSAGDVFPRTAL